MRIGDTAGVGFERPDLSRKDLCQSIVIDAEAVVLSNDSGDDTWICFNTAIGSKKKSFDNFLTVRTCFRNLHHREHPDPWHGGNVVIAVERIDAVDGDRGILGNPARGSRMSRSRAVTSTATMRLSPTGRPAQLHPGPERRRLVIEGCFFGPFAAIRDLSQLPSRADLGKRVLRLREPSISAAGSVGSRGVSRITTFAIAKTTGINIWQPNPNFDRHDDHRHTRIFGVDNDSGGSGQFGNASSIRSAQHRRVPKTTFPASNISVFASTTAPIRRSSAITYPTPARRRSSSRRPIRVSMAIQRGGAGQRPVDGRQRNFRRQPNYEARSRDGDGTLDRRF